MESLLHFLLRCALSVTTIGLFVITTIVIDKSILSTIYFVLLAAFVHTAQVSYSFIWEHAYEAYSILGVFNIFYLLIYIIDCAYENNATKMLLRSNLVDVFNYAYAKDDPISQRVVHISLILAFSASIFGYIFIHHYPIAFKVSLPFIIRRRKQQCGRFLLISAHRTIDVICALLFASSAAEHVSPLSVPQMVCAILLCYEIEESKKTICYFTMGLYIPLITVIKLSFFVYKGPIRDLDICENVNADKWMYWFGLVSDGNSLYVSVCCLMGIHFRSFVEHLYLKYTDRHRGCDNLLPFPSVDYKNANSATINLIAFYINYGYYKFGFEIYNVFWLASIVTSVNIISLISLALLMTTVVMERSRIRRIFLFFVFFHIGVFAYEFIAHIGTPPSHCFRTFIAPEYAPYLALPNIARSKFDGTLLLYFLNVVLSLMQYQLFKIESANDENYGGGSNDGVFEQKDDNAEVTRTNPIPNFYSQDARLFLDAVKQCVFSYYHWLVLLLIFSNGIRMTSPVFLSIGHIIFAFLNFWRGTDLYLSSLKIFRRKWRVITLYLLGSLFLQIFALIMRAVLDEFIVSKSSNKRAVAVCRMLHVYFKRPDEYVIDGIEPYANVDVRAYSFDVIVFAALLLHLRMIVSWHFQHTVIDFRADRIICYRGQVLHDQLLLKAMTFAQQKDRFRVGELKRRTAIAGKMELPFGRFQVQSIRGWNKVIFDASEEAYAADCQTCRKRQSNSESERIESIVSAVVTNEDSGDSGPPQERKRKKKPYVTVSELVAKTALWLGRMSLDYRYIRFVLDNEKKLLAERLPKDMGTSIFESSINVRGLNLGKEVCLVNHAHDIVKYMDEVHRRWLRLPILWRLLSAFSSVVLSNTAFLCYCAIIVLHAQAACLLTLPLPLIIFFWAALSSRPSYSVWIIIIFYVQVIIVVMMNFKYSFLPWTCNRGLHCADWNMRRAGRFVGIADEPISVILFCLLVFALFTHRYSMRRNGSWWGCYARLLQPEQKDKRCWLVSMMQEMFNPRCPLPSDYYPWMVVSHFVAIAVLILRFSDFDTAKRNVFSFDGDLKLPDYFVVFFMVSICELIFDRILYLRKAAKLKFVYLIIETLFTHAFVIVVLVIRQNDPTEVLRHSNVGLFFWYLARCVHILASAFQIRDGYPQYMSGRSMRSNNPISWLLYVVCFFAVPLFEICVIIDWTFTDTSLPLFNFYTLETIDFYLYFINGMRKFELFYAKKRGEKTAAFTKAMLGGGIILGFLFILVCLLMFISENAFVAIYLPKEMDFSLRLADHPILYQSHLQELPTISETEFEKLKSFFSDDVRATALLEGCGERSMLDVRMPKESALWYVHPHWEDDLKRLLRDESKSIKLKARLTLKRMHLREQSESFLQKSDTQTIEHTGEWDMRMSHKMRRRFAEVLDSRNCNASFTMNITDIMPPLLMVPTEGNIRIPFPVTRRRHTYERLYFLYETRLVVTSDCISSIPGQFVAHTISMVRTVLDSTGKPREENLEPRFVFFVAKVSSALTKKVLKSSVSSLVVLIVMVFLLSSKMRDVLMTKPFALPFNEIGDPSRLIQLCDDIFCARQARLFDLEHDLFGKLIYIIRSSEALIHYTVYNMKNLRK
ncbi:Piezo-type mechanosensitive ion channel component 2 [Toxocara canis]|uniref:Piezo-type mechanosensitive ion channel component 2 n=1 Tax=Toxocara canis TaxID=6265 RepID=A0A0B2UWB1_TOXCA|nr:Piezo-type mechanosensitive ion channel component 2 [Toxocara canis]